MRQDKMKKEAREEALREIEEEKLRDHTYKQQ